MKSRGFALLMEMGTGKTLTSVAILGRAYLNKLCQRVLIIAPKSVVPVWAEELNKYATYPFTIVPLEGSSEKKTQLLQRISGDGLHIAVINYESVALIEKALSAWKPDFIVCDESSRIKNPQTKQSKAIHRLARQCKYRLILTRTPIQNNPLDFFSQYKALDINLFGTSFFAFKNSYAVLGNYNQPVAYKNLPELVAKAHSIAFRVTKADALDLPETVDDIRYVPLETKADALYRQLVKESYAELSKGEVTATNVLTRLLRLQQTTGGFLKSDDGERVEQVSRAKLNALEDIIDDVVDSGKKVVVFARFTAEINAIAKLCDKKAIGYARVCGATKDRAEEVRRFQEDGDCSVFIGQIQTSALGLTLTAADTAVFYSANFNYVDFTQSKARVHRIGQKNKCTYIYLVVKGTIDETVLTALAGKEDISKTLVDNWRSLITGGMNDGK